MEYTVLDREETADLVLTEGDSLQVSLVNGSGTVDVLIGREGKEPVYRGTRQQYADFVLIVPESGTYRISVTGHRARGQAAFTVMGSRPE
ncbi:MAG: hypothetical protein J5564_03470 [Clostridia bacterium]|nr:hypothetical protein [Clostridia bacterium]